MLSFLSKEFEVRSLANDRFIGVDINRNRVKHTINLSQPEYTKTVLERYGMSNCATLSVPADPSVYLHHRCAQKQRKRNNKRTLFRS